MAEVVTSPSFPHVVKKIQPNSISWSPFVVFLSTQLLKLTLCSQGVPFLTLS